MGSNGDDGMASVGLKNILDGHFKSVIANTVSNEWIKMSDRLPLQGPVILLWDRDHPECLPSLFEAGSSVSSGFSQGEKMVWNPAIIAWMPRPLDPVASPDEQDHRLIRSACGGSISKEAYRDCRLVLSRERAEVLKLLPPAKIFEQDWILNLRARCAPAK